MPITALQLLFLYLVIVFSKMNFVEGEIICIDKPYEWTSFDVVKKVRGSLRIKKVGHAGTLDPLATGLLILCTGKKTKTINDLMGQKKTYTGCIELGATTPSLDKETEVSETKAFDHITEEAIVEATQKFTGNIAQLPPIFSAIKVGGERLYKKARRGDEVEIKAREIHIHSFEIEKIELPNVYFKVSCSKGTYIRSLARDFGLALDTVSYLTSLRRTHIGDFSVENAKSPTEFVDYAKSLLHTDADI